MIVVVCVVVLRVNESDRKLLWGECSKDVMQKVSSKYGITQKGQQQ